MLEQCATQGFMDRACKVNYSGKRHALIWLTKRFFPLGRIGSQRRLTSAESPQLGWHSFEEGATWRGSPVYSIAPELPLEWLTLLQQLGYRWCTSRLCVRA